MGDAGTAPAAGVEGASAIVGSDGRYGADHDW